MRSKRGTRSAAEQGVHGEARGRAITAHHKNQRNQRFRLPLATKIRLELPHRIGILIHQNNRHTLPTQTSHRAPIPNQNRDRNHRPRNPPPVHRPTLHVAIILIRYGYVAIAIAHDETIIVSKTDTRWVPNRHRAGGQSANRFKRSREKWAREFFDKSARLATERFNTYPHHIDHLIFGGDKHVINQFLQRANLPNNLSDRILTRRLNTLRPNRNALKDTVKQAWSSTIYELATSPLP